MDPRSQRFWSIIHSNLAQWSGLLFWPPFILLEMNHNGKNIEATWCSHFLFFSKSDLSHCCVYIRGFHWRLIIRILDSKGLSLSRLEPPLTTHYLQTGTWVNRTFGMELSWAWIGGRIKSDPPNFLTGIWRQMEVSNDHGPCSSYPFYVIQIMFGRDPWDQTQLSYLDEEGVWEESSRRKGSLWKQIKNPLLILPWPTLSKSFRKTCEGRTGRFSLYQEEDLRQRNLLPRTACQSPPSPHLLPTKIENTETFIIAINSL